MYASKIFKLKSYCEIYSPKIWINSNIHCSRSVLLDSETYLCCSEQSKRMLVEFLPSAMQVWLIRLVTYSKNFSLKKKKVIPVIVLDVQWRSGSSSSILRKRNFAFWSEPNHVYRQYKFTFSFTTLRPCAVDLNHDPSYYFKVYSVSYISYNGSVWPPVRQNLLTSVCRPNL